MPRPSTLPSLPSVADVAIDVDTSAEYAILVSMYEVYNDRIFDLLTTTANGKAASRRRALLFKSTENSPDRKVVAGLRKVVCSTLEDALLVLETGLQERRVAGTGSNAVSSRSHGFFCLDIKKRHRATIPGPWTSSTLTVVDLAGSERARTAKTAGATLAEAGKINESLMYLGQCMQMQSDNAQSTTPSLVPFRQCKLTELLFSNSFTRDHLSKRPQKAIMIVAADPLGDFNATSQILRYSALAREITVPRIPSVTSTILAGTSTAPSGRSTPVQEELEVALASLAHLREQLELTQLLLAEETERRQQAEHSWRVAESRTEDLEAEIREEVWGEMEARLAHEQRRWRAAREEELEARDEHLDRKLEILANGITVYEDETAEKENRLASSVPSEKTCDAIELEGENAMLRDKVANLEREKEGLRSPSKKMRVMKTRKWTGSGMGLDDML
nr:kinesin-like motor protein 9 [Quercus suber]